MKISFATTCMGRLHHLKETLPLNMNNNPAGFGYDVEFNVLDYNSQDGLEDWIKTDPQMVQAMHAGVLRYAKNDAPQKFHMSHAKNQAVRLTTGEIVCNIDADNFTGPGFAQFLAKSFEENPDSVMNPSRSLKEKIGGGIWGRVAMQRNDFFQLGGYDEVRYKKWGGEEVDLVRRAKGMGLQNFFINHERFLSFIPHSDEERVVNMVDSPDQIAAEAARVDQINHGKLPALARRFNLITEIVQTMLRPVQVNNGGEFGKGSVRFGMDGRSLVFKTAEVPHLSRAYISAVNFPEFIIERLRPELRTASSYNEHDLTPKV